jgi:tetraacyldisaccharide 4'-kinase
MKSKLLFLLLSPLALLYGLITIIRNKLFDAGILQSYSPDIPTICIGNLTVGGTGKTPHTEFLLNLLITQYQTAVLSRGYGRKTKGFIFADKSHTSNIIGDESLQIYRKFPQSTVVVCEDRKTGILNIQKLRPETEVILLDDAFQHRRVKTGFSILLTDYNRLHTRDFMMPSGRLREPASGYRRSDILIVTKCPEEIQSSEINQITKEVDPENQKEVFFTTFEYGQLYPLFENAGVAISEDHLVNSELLLVTGIASPERIEKYLKQFTESVYSLTYSDHHHFSEKELKHIESRFNALKSDNKMILITEKDAARLINFKGISNTLKKYIFVLPIRVKVLDNKEETLTQKISEYVRKNQRNS